MGMFDGKEGKTEAGSTAEVAKWIKLPVILVVDCWSSSRYYICVTVCLIPRLSIKGVSLIRTNHQDNLYQAKTLLVNLTPM